ncbi:MAG: ubiquitin-like small modifier protein 1 [Candidatus Hydrothermarchaeales archaeon]
MPRINVQPFASLRETIGSKALEVDTPAATVGELIDLLALEHNPRFNELLIDPEGGEVRNTILVNGRNIESMNKMKTRMKDGDTVSIIPPVGGG